MNPPAPSYFFGITAVEQLLLKAAELFGKIEVSFIASSRYLFIFRCTRIEFYNFIVF